MPATPPRPRTVGWRRPRVAGTVGVLNILYGLFLVLASAGSVIMTVGLPQLSILMDQVQAEQREQIQERRKARQEALIERAAAAKSPEAWAEARADLVLLDRSLPPEIPMMTTGFGMFGDPEVRRYVYVQAATMTSLNILLIASGFGLWRARRWGRTLAVWASVLKLPALVIAATVGVWWVAPRLADGWAADFQGLMTAMWGRTEPPPELRSEWETAQVSAGRAFGLLLALYAAYGMVYPAIVVVVLTRPGVKAEFPDRRPADR